MRRRPSMVAAGTVDRETLERMSRSSWKFATAVPV
jgi:hypothetical protein